LVSGADALRRYSDLLQFAARRCAQLLEEAMADLIRVRPEELLISGAQVKGQADDVEAGHAASDANIYAAQAGMVGSSAAAMEAKLAQWQSTTVALTNRLTEHAQALTAGAEEFTDSDRHNAAIIADVGRQPSDTGMSASD
jgi:WXG100 family type VII secretion target